MDGHIHMLVDHLQSLAPYDTEAGQQITRVLCDIRATALDQYYTIGIHCCTVSHASNYFAGFVYNTNKMHVK